MSGFKRWRYSEKFFPPETISGFTIVEVLIAMALAAVLLSTLYFAYSAVVDSTRNYRQVSDFYQTARITLSNMAREISGAFQPRSVKDTILFSATNEWFRGMEADRLSLVTTSCLRSSEAETGYDTYEVSYYRGFGEQEGLLLMRRCPFFNIEEPFEEGEELILAENVRALNFEYFDGSDWLEEWDTETQEKLPLAIRVTLALGLEEEKEPRRFSLVASLPMTEREEEEETTGEKK